MRGVQGWTGKVFGAGVLTLGLLLVLFALVFHGREEQEVVGEASTTAAAMQPREGAGTSLFAVLEEGDPQPGHGVPPCRVHGQVTFEDGQPVHGAIIEMLTAKTNTGTWVDSGIRTGADGWYELPRQDRCPLLLAATLDGRGRGEEVENPFLGADAAASQDAQRRDILVEPACAVGGRVIDQHGSSVSGSEVSVATQEGADWESGKLRRASIFEDRDLMHEVVTRWGTTAITNEDGEFSFPALAPHSWIVHAEAPGFDSARVTLSFEADDVPEPLEITLRKVQPWTVQVIDEEDRPIPDAVVCLGTTPTDIRLPANLDPFVYCAEEAATDDHGIARFEERGNARRSIDAFAAGYDRRSIRSEEHLDSALVRLYPAGKIVWKIEPAPADGTQCMATNQRPPTGHDMRDGTPVISRIVYPDAGGRFVIEDATAGAYELMITCSPVTGANIREKFGLAAAEVRDLGAIQCR